MKTLNTVGEKIDTKKIQADTTKYVEFIITKLLIKMIEQQANEKGKHFDVKNNITNSIKRLILRMFLKESQKR